MTSDNAHPLDTAPSAPFAGDLTLLQVANVVLKARMPIILVASLIALVMATTILFKTRTYSSGMSFLPQSGKTPSPISGLAAQFGVDVSASSPGSSPQFYADLAQSRHLLAPISEQSFEVDGRPTPLAVVLETDNKNPGLQRDRTIRKLQGNVSTAVDLRTSVVTVTVKAPSPRVAFDLATRILQALSEYNLATRQSQARSERVFTEKQRDDAAAELRQAEDSLQDFLQANRVLGAPALVAQQSRLTSKISLRNQIYAQLAGSYEQAKLDEVRDTPVLTVLDRPEIPVLPDARGLVTRTILTWIVAVILGVVVAVLADRFSADATAVSGADEFVILRHAAWQDVKHPFAAVRRAMRRSA